MVNVSNFISEKLQYFVFLNEYEYKKFQNCVQLLWCSNIKFPKYKEPENLTNRITCFDALSYIVNNASHIANIRKFAYLQYQKDILLGTCRYLAYSNARYYIIRTINDLIVERYDIDMIDMKCRFWTNVPIQKEKSDYIILGPICDEVFNRYHKLKTDDVMILRLITNPTLNRNTLVVLRDRTSTHYRCYLEYDKAGNTYKTCSEREVHTDDWYVTEITYLSDNFLNICKKWHIDILNNNLLGINKEPKNMNGKVIIVSLPQGNFIGRVVSKGAYGFTLDHPAKIASNGMNIQLMEKDIEIVLSESYMLWKDAFNTLVFETYIAAVPEKVFNRKYAQEPEKPAGTTSKIQDNTQKEFEFNEEMMYVNVGEDTYRVQEVEDNQVTLTNYIKTIRINKDIITSEANEMEIHQMLTGAFYKIINSDKYVTEYLPTTDSLLACISEEVAIPVFAEGEWFLVSKCEKDDNDTIDNDILKFVNTTFRVYRDTNLLILEDQDDEESQFVCEERVAYVQPFDEISSQFQIFPSSTEEITIDKCCFQQVYVLETKDGYLISFGIRKGRFAIIGNSGISYVKPEDLDDLEKIHLVHFSD